MPVSRCASLFYPKGTLRSRIHRDAPAIQFCDSSHWRGAQISMEKPGNPRHRPSILRTRPRLSPGQIPLDALTAPVVHVNSRSPMKIKTSRKRSSNPSKLDEVKEGAFRHRPSRAVASSRSRRSSGRQKGHTSFTGGAEYVVDFLP